MAGWWGIGLISSRLNVEGPLLKDRLGFLFTARRSYADLFLLFAKDPALRSTKLYFYDMTAKLNYTLSDKHRLFLSGYFGRDVFRSADWLTSTGVMLPRAFAGTGLSRRAFC
jgi:hypothetical protein